MNNDKLQPEDAMAQGTDEGGVTVVPEGSFDHATGFEYWDQPGSEVKPSVSTEEVMSLFEQLTHRQIPRDQYTVGRAEDGFAIEVIATGESFLIAEESSDNMGVE